MSIRAKLIVILLLLPTLTLTVAGSVFIYNDIKNFKRNMVRDLSILAATVGESARASLIFNDRIRAEAILSSLAKEPQIESAVLYDAENQGFAVYRPGVVRLPDSLPLAGVRVAEGSIEIYDDIFLNGEKVGSIYVSAHTRELESHIREYVAQAGAVLVAVLLASAALALRLQKIVSQPILSLAATAKAISQKPDYSVRVQHDAEDELGVLFRGFNEMLEQIEKRETELESYRRKLEELVRERTRELEAAQKELVLKERLATLGQLTAMVSHEIRNPLGTIRNAIFALSRMVRNKIAGTEQLLDLAERNILRCDAIIEEMLDLTRIGEQRPESTPVDAWLDEILGEMAGKYPEITLHQRLQSGLVMKLSREQFRRAVVNVVENAFQAMREHLEKSGGLPGAEVKVVVEARVAGPNLEIQVEDRGPGISPELMGKVFDPLFSTKGFGVGLGLTIVKRVMENLEGEVRIASCPPQGTRVTLVLPLARRSAAP